MKALAVLGVASVIALSGCATTQKLLPRSAETPMAQILKLKPELKDNLVTTEIRQYFNRVENPTVGVVKVTETNLMDDSIRSIRTTYNFKWMDEKWVMANAKQEYQCHRAKSKTQFQTAKCP